MHTKKAHVADDAEWIDSTQIVCEKNAISCCTYYYDKFEQGCVDVFRSGFRNRTDFVTFQVVLARHRSFRDDMYATKQVSQEPKRVGNRVKPVVNTKREGNQKLDWNWK